jgi:hypothetical protein
MNSQHPITPPPELERQWSTKYIETSMSFTDLVTEVARWGADQRGTANEAELQEARDEELEACCKWLTEHTCFHPNSDLIKDLRAAMRPKPPSVKEQGLESLDEVIKCLKILVPGATADGIHIENIRRALEQLP